MNNYPSLYINYTICDGLICMKECDWPDGENIVEVRLDPIDRDVREQLRDLIPLLPFPVSAIDAGWDCFRRGRIYHLIKSNNPIARAEYRMVKFWSFWAWWEVRIIKTLEVWGLAEIDPAEIIDWHCVGRRS